MKDKLINERSSSSHICSAMSLLEIMISLTILALALSALGGSIFGLNRGNKMILENRRAVEVAQMVLERVQSEPWKTLGRSPATWHRREVPVSGVSNFVDELSSITETEFMHRPLVDEPTGLDLYDYLQYGDVDFRHMSVTDDEQAPTDLTIQDFKRDRYNLPYVMTNQMAEFNGTDNDSEAPANGTLPTEIVTRYNTPLRYNWLQFLGVTNKRSGLNNLRVYVEYYKMEPFQGVTNRTDFDDAVNDDDNALKQSHVLLNLEELDELDAESVVIRVIITWDRLVGGTGRHVLTVARR